MRLAHTLAILLTVSLVLCAGCGVRRSVAVGEVAVPTEPEVLPAAGPIPEDNGEPQPPPPEPEPLPPVDGCYILDCTCVAPATEENRAALFELLNQHREDNGLVPFEYSLRLEAAADAHAEQMYLDDFFGHEWPDGTAPPDRAVAYGYCNELVGENIARGLNAHGTAGDVMDALVASEGHNENMLFPEYRYVGIGYYHIETERGHEYWWVQLMAVP